MTDREQEALVTLDELSEEQVAVVREGVERWLMAKAEDLRILSQRPGLPRQADEVAALGRLASCLRRGEFAVPDQAVKDLVLSRSLDATYVRDLLATAERDAVDARLVRRVGEVVSIAEHLGVFASPLELTLADGQRVGADRLVLALGPLTAGDPVTVPPDLKASSLYVSDAWADGALDAATSDRLVLIIGTGLSMVDVALTLGGVPNGPSVRAVSRHGLVPRRHRRGLTRVRRFHLPTGSGTIEPIFAAILAQVGRVSRQGDDWRDVIDSMRSSTPQIWKALDTAEKERFLADFQRLWDVHRFRMAPQVADRFEALEAAGRIRASASSIASLEIRSGRVRAALRVPGSHEVEMVEVDRVINCSGAGCDLRRQAPPLLASLIGAGRGRPDELGLGLDVDKTGALLDAGGVQSERIFTIGALRKGVEWEAIGITEIRDHAAGIAQRIYSLAELGQAEERESGSSLPPLGEAAA